MVTSHHSVFAQSRTLQEQPGEESDGAEESSESDVDDEGSDSKDNEEANKTLTEQCNFVTDCEMCFRGERSKEAGCSATGRRQKLECIITSGEGKKRRVQKFESCKRTNADEEFLFVSALIFSHMLVAYYNFRYSSYPLSPRSIFYL
jgi:hypothetical protein